MSAQRPSAAETRTWPEVAEEPIADLPGSIRVFAVYLTNQPSRHFEPMRQPSKGTVVLYRPSSSQRDPIGAREALMPVVLRSATEADAKHVESLLAELGYPSKEADVRHRLRRSLHSDTSCFLVAQSASGIIGLVSAELVPYFPNGSTICRVTGLVVSTHHRGQGIGEKLVTGAADFAREHHCSGIEITSAEHRLDAHRFYQRLGFSRTSLRFFHAL